MLCFRNQFLILFAKLDREGRILNKTVLIQFSDAWCNEIINHYNCKCGALLFHEGWVLCVHDTKMKICFENGSFFVQFCNESCNKQAEKRM